MNRNQEAFGNFEEFDRLERRFLEWLQADSRSSGTPDGGLPTEETVISSGSPQSSSDEPTNGEVDDLDPLLSEDLEFLAIAEMSSDGDSSDTSVNLVSDVEQLHRFSGDTPVIEERSQTILKSRLRTEIEHHPPLFPWETEIVEYEPETIDFTQAQVVPSMFGHSYSHSELERGIGFWTPQLPKMNGLTPLPHEVLGQLLEQCSQAMKSNLREWAKLVNVVEKSLFPGHSRELNQMASRLSIAQQHRSSTTDVNLLPKMGDLDSSIAYEVATPTQQMLMSLLAAREIIGNLTLELSSSQPKLERQWLTAAGLLTLNIEYQPANLQGYSAIGVGATLPCGGSVSLTGGQSQTQSERLNPGVLNLELSDRHLQESYLLEVHLDSAEQHSLTFALRVRR